MALPRDQGHDRNVNDPVPFEMTDEGPDSYTTGSPQDSGDDFEPEQFEDATFDQPNEEANSVQNTMNMLAPEATQNNTVNNTMDMFATGATQNITINIYQNKSGPIDGASSTRRRRRKNDPPELPTFRQACKMKNRCKKKSKCRFVHPRQRKYFGMKALNELKDYVSKDSRGLPEHGGI